MEIAEGEVDRANSNIRVYQSKYNAAVIEHTNAKAKTARLSGELDILRTERQDLETQKKLLAGLKNTLQKALIVVSELFNTGKVCIA